MFACCEPELRLEPAFDELTKAGLGRPAELEPDCPRCLLDFAADVEGGWLGLTSGDGRARFALASAVVLLFLRGTEAGFVGPRAGDAFGVAFLL